jgi:hypothetical protein
LTGREGEYPADRYGTEGRQYRHEKADLRIDNLLTVRFRPDSPHLAATIPLEALSDEQAAASFLNVLQELAAGASTHRK